MSAETDRPADPADLYGQVQDLLGRLRDLRRATVELRREYAGLDPAELATDDLGDPVTAEAVTAAVVKGLAAVEAALNGVDDAFDAPLAYASRLLRSR